MSSAGTVPKKGDRCAALEPVRQGVRGPHGRLRQGGRPEPRPAARRGSQYRARQFRAEIRWLGIRSTPACVRDPECNGVTGALHPDTQGGAHLSTGTGTSQTRGAGRIPGLSASVMGVMCWSSIWQSPEAHGPEASRGNPSALHPAMTTQRRTFRRGGRRAPIEFIRLGAGAIAAPHSRVMVFT